MGREHGDPAEDPSLVNRGAGHACTNALWVLKRMPSSPQSEPPMVLGACLSVTTPVASQTTGVLPMSVFRQSPTPGKRCSRDLQPDSLSPSQFFLGKSGGHLSAKEMNFALEVSKPGPWAGRLLTCATTAPGSWGPATWPAQTAESPAWNIRYALTR